MITYLNGTIVEKQPTRVVLDVGGIGYEVLIPLSSYDRLPAKNESCRILTYDYVREDNHQLFGFMTEAERGMFVLLMGISGIGPKLALSALSGLSVRELKCAIIEGDTKRLSTIAGVGRKVAERIVVELRDRLGESEALEAVSGVEDVSPDDMKTHDAIMALISLGYKQAAARKMVTAVSRKNADLTVEDIIKHALRG